MRSPSSSLWRWFVVVMACLLAWGISSAALRPLYPLDETRYASVAWTMVREGSWWPMLGSQLYTHKPPLLFWLMHVAWKIGGYSVPPLRVLTLVLTMACLWRSMTLSAALWGRRPGVLLVPALLAGNWYVSFMGVALYFDMALTLWVVMAIEGLWHATQDRPWGHVWAGCAMGLGILTKGPLVAPFVIGPMLAMPWVVGRPIKGWWRGLLLTAVLAALPPVCWLAWLGMAHGYRTVGAIIWNQGAGRVVAAFDHARPWWWYGPWLVVLWLPWITWPQLWRLRGALWRDVGGRLCLAWMVPPMVLLSLASGKQPHYLLPLFPAIALVLGRLQEQHCASREDSLLGPGVAFLLIGFLPCLGWLLAPKLHSVMTLHQAGQWAMIFTLLGVILIWMGRRLTREEKVMGLATSALLGLCLGQPVLVEVLAPRYDLRAFAVAIARLQAQGMTVAKAGAYHGQFDFLGHLPRPIAVLPRAEVCERADLLQATVVIAELPEQWRPKAEGCLLRQPYRGHQLALLSPAAACAAQRQLQ